MAAGMTRVFVKYGHTRGGGLRLRTYTVPEAECFEFARNIAACGKALSIWMGPDAHRFGRSGWSWKRA